MGKLVYSMMVSLDGYIETPDHSLDWVRIDEELHRYSNDEARAASLFVYGRRLYETMAGFWPTAGLDEHDPAFIREFADIWRAKPKLVYSKTLESAGWHSELRRELTRSDVERLKADASGDVTVGGAALAAECIRLGLVDEFEWIVQPVVLGRGTPFMPQLERRIDLELVGRREFASGVFALRYAAR